MTMNDIYVHIQPLLLADNEEFLQKSVKFFIIIKQYLVGFMCISVLKDDTIVGLISWEVTKLLFPFVI